MEDKVKVWLARDKNGKLFVFSDIPKRIINYWGTASFDNLELDCTKFPSVKWDDDVPTEAYITLAEPQEQLKQEQPTPKQAIDWEQRRYEIAKEMLPVIYRQGMEVQKHGQSVKRKDTAYYAVIFADTLIKELKEQSE